MGEKRLRTREEIAKKYQWNLQDMFASDELWEKEVSLVLDLCKELQTYQGRLAENAQVLLEFLEKKDRALCHGERVYVHGNQRLHENTASSKYQGWSAKADSVMVALNSALSFMNPEILAIEEGVLEQFYKEEPKLEQYRRAITEILRLKAHTRSEEVEAVLAQTQDMAVAPYNIYSMFNNADICFSSIKDVEGNLIQVTHGNFSVLMQDKDRRLRKNAFRAVYRAYKEHGNTVAAIFQAQLKQENFNAKMRNYESVRAMHLAEGNIPESVYDNLIAAVHKHLPAMHRYMALRKKMLGVEQLHMYDIQVPMVDVPEKKYSYETAKEIVKAALAPMGEAYGSVAADAMEHDWVDVYEHENKLSGAYSWSAYGTHPYVLLNYQDDLQSVFTLAHEMGHAMHSYYSHTNQPYTYANYLIFVAEVASTCNESLLMQHLLETCSEETERRYLMNHYLEEFRSIVFRQTMFAEFEMLVHKKMAEGENLSKEAICRIYHELNEQYYGPDVVIDAEIDYEWMRVPHFYTSFYVYQYATGFSAAVAFSKKIIEEGKPAVDKYIQNFLSGGSSKDPIDLLKDAGVDMRTAAPIEEALCVFEKYLLELENCLLEKNG